MSKINGLPDSVNYLYGAEVGEPVRFDLFRRPAEDYADLAELEMIAGCIGCHDSDDQSTLIVHNGEGNPVDGLIELAYISDIRIGTASAKPVMWLTSDAPEDYDEVMNEIPRSPKLIRQVCLGIAVFWLITFAVIATS